MEGGGLDFSSNICTLDQETPEPLAMEDTPPAMRQYYSVALFVSCAILMLHLEYRARVLSGGRAAVVLVGRVILYALLASLVAPLLRSTRYGAIMQAMLRDGWAFLGCLHWL